MAQHRSSKSSNKATVNPDFDNEKLRRVQEKTNKIAEVMADNINIIYSREEKTSDIHYKSEILKDKASEFNKTVRAKTVWWRRLINFFLSRR